MKQNSEQQNERAGRGAKQRANPASPGVSRYFLYGFDPRDFDERFLHVERIEDQLPYHGLNARPHLHEGLHQFMLFHRGGGEILIEEDRIPFETPVLIVLPAGVVHGFRFGEDTAGPIVTVSEHFLNEVRGIVERDVAAAILGPALLPLSNACESLDELKLLFRSVERNYGTVLRGRHTALTSSLALLLVAIARLSSDAPGAAEVPARHAIFRAFQEAVEKSFRRQPTVEELAEDIRVTPGRLNAICRATAQKSPQEILHMRLAIEAKRLLLYGSQTVGEVAYILGFKDPAYFSRFFKREVGASPAAFRKSRTAG